MKRNIYYEDEEYCSDYLNLLVLRSSRVFQMVVYNDDDENYIPNLNFEYIVCDCKENKNLRNTEEWEKIFSLDKPIIFTNTSYLFEQFSDIVFFGEKINDGCEAWVRAFYYFFRDRFWDEKKSRLIFLVTEENLDKMFKSVNAGFSIELIPVYVKKNDNKKLIKK